MNRLIHRGEASATAAQLCAQCLPVRFVSVHYCMKDTGAYEIIEIIEIVYLGFRVVFDGKKS